MKTRKKMIAKKGEDVACTFLMKRGFSILERNYLKRWGRVHIIAEKDQRLHFLEVRSFSRKLRAPVIHETVESYAPQRKIPQNKLKRMKMLVAAYLLDRQISLEKPWNYDGISVLLDMRQKIARVSYVKDIIWGA